MRVDMSKLPKGDPDRVIGAWERLAEVLRYKPGECSGGDKLEWANLIAPHLDLTDPKSPSLKTFIDGVEKLIDKTDNGA